MLLVLYTAGITKDGTLEEKAEARRKAKAVLYRLWLVGSGLWLSFWLLVLLYGFDHHPGSSLPFILLGTAVLPPTCIYGLARLLGWAFRPAL